MAFKPFDCPQEDALQCIEEMKQRVVVYLGMMEEGIYSIEENPPKFEAYQKRLLARDNYENKDLYIQLLNEAIAIDSTYFEPQVARVEHYYNRGDYKIADSLIKGIGQESRLSKRQKALLNFCSALMKGKNDLIHSNFEYEYNLVPKDMATNQTFMVLSLQYVNKPELVEDIFNQVSMENLDLENCLRCAFRYFTMGLAYNELGEFQRTIALLEPIVHTIQRDYLYRILAIAYAETSQDDKITDLLNKLELTGELQDAFDVRYYVGRTYLMRDQPEKAKSYLESLAGQSRAKPEQIAEALYFAGDFGQAALAFEVVEKTPYNNLSRSAMKAVCYFKDGKEEMAKALIESFEDMRDEFDFGDIEYAYAIYYAATGQDELALRELQKSVARGKKYYPTDFQNDPNFKDYVDTPTFQSIMTYWH